MTVSLISVIVPVYNTEPWLRRCLDSICAQTYPHLEIICVDDGSTDESLQLLHAYAARDARIKVYHQENAGLSAARNTALEHATGEWVTGVDSDDYLAPGVYERAVTCILPEVDMVFFGVQEVTEETVPMPHREYFDLPGAGVYEMTPELAEKLNVCFWSKLWRRSVLELHQLRFPHGLVHEDEALYYLAAPHIRKVAVNPVKGYCYVQRAGSIMNSSQTLHQTVARFQQVISYVYTEYRRRHVAPWQSPWFRMMLFRVYRAFYHRTSESDREELNEAFYEGMQKLQVGTYLENDYRFRCMKPVCGWRRLFLSRYLNAEVYRFLKVPVWLVEYEKGVAIRHSCMLWEVILRRLGFRKAVSGS